MYVRQTLKYSPPVFDSHTKDLFSDIDVVLCYAARYVENDFSQQIVLPRFYWVFSSRHSKYSMPTAKWLCRTKSSMALLPHVTSVLPFLHSSPGVTRGATCNLTNALQISGLPTQHKIYVFLINSHLWKILKKSKFIALSSSGNRHKVQ